MSFGGKVVVRVPRPHSFASDKPTIGRRNAATCRLFLARGTRTLPQMSPVRSRFPGPASPPSPTGVATAPAAAAADRCNHRRAEWRQGGPAARRSLPAMRTSAATRPINPSRLAAGSVAGLMPCHSALPSLTCRPTNTPGSVRSTRRAGGTVGELPKAALRRGDSWQRGSGSAGTRECREAQSP